MLNKIKSTILIILWTSLLFYGQINIHKKITKEDGLVGSQVSSILQDSKGYIWFATYDGVSRWDGIHFKNFQTHNGMLTSTILDIKEGYDGKIYMANYQGGIIIYNDGILDTINEKNGLLSNVVTCIGILQDNSILFGSYGSKITILKNGVLTNWSQKVDFPSDKNYTVREIYQESDGTIYFATQNGLVIYKNNKFKIISKEDGLNSDFIFGIAGNNDGKLYLSTYKGINVIENGNISKLKNFGEYEEAFCSKIILTKNGTMYAATDRGIISEKNGNINILTEQNGLAFNYCFSVFEDNNGTIYFGTNGKGVSIYDPDDKIVNFNKSTGLPNESIWSILKSKDGTVYFGSVEGLIIYKNENFKILNSKNGLSGDFVRVIKESKNGDILIGTTTGLSVINKNQIINLDWNDAQGINQVYSILESHTGDIYLGTPTGVVIFRNSKVIESESEFITNGIEKGLKTKLINSISQTKSGMLVFGSHTGLVTFDKGQFNFFTAQNGLVDNSANATHITSDGSILVGTLKGLNIIRDGKVIDTIDVNKGLSNNSIADIEEYNGKIFVATYHGLNILNNYPDSLQITQLYKKDGLIEDDFTHEGTFVDNDGNLWLGTLEGVSKYNSNLDNPNAKPPKIYLSGLQLHNQDYPFSQFLQNPEFSYDQNFLNFVFTGINLSAPEKIKYSYRLSNVDNNWVETLRNIAPYTNLDDGNYTFEVKARNEWGYWSEPAKLAFTINPAWWKTWWFYTLIILTVSSFIAFISSYRYRHLLAIEKMRTKISADLHDSVGSGLSEISILTELLKFQVPEDKHELKSGLGNVSTISRTLIENMGDIVWLVNPKKDALKDLFKRLQLSYHEVLKYSNTDLIVENLDELENVRLPMNFRHHLYLIFKEAINNAIKYSNADLLTLKIKTDGNLLTVTFSDNGKGFDLNQDKIGNGLLNMQNRAKEIGGNIKYFSEPNKGTKIIFTGKFSKHKYNFI
ncbi:MAG: hypothetical protein H6610_07245 [Ignavibacteriales bacterium]|nr:hypothetical protein [Ignavibacteriales bacterium]MCB9210726.1 hypothetical protein [Ignavibacteriales bacterium]MCB9219237.1 hypothetical protein [Ignavibacteriales bacterium]MCB9260130.1 hypothetical protein [Ignavibacteriales bacterium]